MSLNHHIQVCSLKGHNNREDVEVAYTYTNTGDFVFLALADGYSKESSARGGMLAEYIVSYAKQFSLQLRMIGRSRSLEPKEKVRRLRYQLSEILEIINELTKHSIDRSTLSMACVFPIERFACAVTLGDSPVAITTTKKEEIIVLPKHSSELGKDEVRGYFGGHYSNTPRTRTPEIAFCEIPPPTLSSGAIVMLSTAGMYATHDPLVVRTYAKSYIHKLQEGCSLRKILMEVELGMVLPIDADKTLLVWKDKVHTSNKGLL